MDWRKLLVTLTPIFFAASCGGGAGAPPPAAPRPGLDAIAESYVKLVLAVGRHDAQYVDAYYGPAALKTEADAGQPVPIPELLSRTRALLTQVRSAGEPADRRRFLEKQLVAVEGHLRRLGGESMTLDQECKTLYDADAPHHDVAEFQAAQEALEKIVPGKGPLAQRLEALRRAAYVPHDKVEGALRAALECARKATAPLVSLPPGEDFTTVLVDHKPWGAYNWYLGGFKSRIELNTDLPVEANRLLETMCHEGYPGHHVYNALLESKLVVGKRWVEYTVYPLYSPQSLLAEGSANAGIDVVMTRDERRRALRETMAPASGVPVDAILAVDAIHDAMKPLRYVNGEAARMLLDEHKSEAEVAAFIEKWGLATHERALKSIDFAKTYRSYVFNYTLGQDVVEKWIGDGPDRAARFFDILSRPVVPSDLMRAPS